MRRVVQSKQREGILGAFEAEAVPHLKALFRVAMFLERERNHAEGLVEETFVQALQSFHHFVPGANCCAWLVQIMYGIERKRRREHAPLH